MPFEARLLRANAATRRGSASAGVNEPSPPRADSDTRGLPSARSIGWASAGDKASTVRLGPAAAIAITDRRNITTRNPLFRTNCHIGTVDSTNHKESIDNTSIFIQVLPQPHRFLPNPPLGATPLRL